MGAFQDKIDEERASGIGPAVPSLAEHEAVNHPPHYAFSEYEPIKVIRAWGLSFALGNTVKYAARAGRKDPAKRIEDLKKARFYLDDEIAFWEGEPTMIPPEVQDITRPPAFDAERALREAIGNFQNGGPSLKRVSACDGRLVNY
jgi:hypothetical protein